MAVDPSVGGEPAPPGFRGGLAACIGELGPHRELAPDEERRLGLAVRAGDRRAAVRLVEANLRLVLAVAHRYAGCGASFRELVQEGCIGLMRAVDGFDPGRNARFSAYASWCVRQAVRLAAAEQGRLVRIPTATAAAMERLRLAGDRLTLALGRDPHVDELAVELGTTEQRVTRLQRLSRPPPRPDGVASGEPGGWPPDDLVLAALRLDIYATLARLSARERRVLLLRFGLVDGRPCSLEEIGLRLGLPQERIRWIERQAAARLRRVSGALRPAGSR